MWSTEEGEEAEDEDNEEDGVIELADRDWLVLVRRFPAQADVARRINGDPSMPPPLLVLPLLLLALAFSFRSNIIVW